jgi:hypothetical protein
VGLSLLAAGVVDYALLTDLPGVVPLLELNVSYNSSVIDPSRAVVLPLSWPDGTAAVSNLSGPDGMQLQPPFDLIVGGDLVYYR